MRTTIRVELPKSSPDQLIAKIETVLAEHDRREAAAAGSSKIEPAEVAALRAAVAPRSTNATTGVTTSSAKADRAEAKQREAEAAALYERSALALGVGPGQNLRSPGTALFHLAKVRDGLLNAYRGRENELEAYGFDVVIGTAATPLRRTTAAATTKG